MKNSCCDFILKPIYVLLKVQYKAGIIANLEVSKTLRLETTEMAALVPMTPFQAAVPD